MTNHDRLGLPAGAVFGWLALDDARVTEVEDEILGQMVAWGTPGSDQSQGLVTAVIVRAGGDGPVWSAEVQDAHGVITRVPIASIFNTWRS